MKWGLHITIACALAPLALGLSPQGEGISAHRNTAIRLLLDDGRILTVGLEEYVARSVAAEMSASWPLEALKAQAVASRSFALYRLRHPRHPLYEAEGSVRDQVFAEKGTVPSRIQKAIEATQGEYLSQKSPLPVKAFFHARCGGATDAATTVWQGRPAAAHPLAHCPYCQASPYRWQRRIALATIRAKLGLPRQSSLDLQPIERAPSGRWARLQIQSGPKSFRLTADRFREKLGYRLVPSTHFEWKLTEEALELAGVGAGHGAGMCQWGARFLAERGKTYREILSHYYPQLKLRSGSR